MHLPDTVGSQSVTAERVGAQQKCWAPRCNSHSKVHRGPWPAAHVARVSGSASSCRRGACGPGLTCCFVASLLCSKVAPPLLLLLAPTLALLRAHLACGTRASHACGAGRRPATAPARRVPPAGRPADASPGCAAPLPSVPGTLATRRLARMAGTTRTAEQAPQDASQRLWMHRFTSRGQAQCWCTGLLGSSPYRGVERRGAVKSQQQKDDGTSARGTNR
jgi:hypothetical protein